MCKKLREHFRIVLFGSAMLRTFSGGYFQSDSITTKITGGFTVFQDFPATNCLLLQLLSTTELVLGKKVILG